MRFQYVYHKGAGLCVFVCTTLEESPLNVLKGEIHNIYSTFIVKSFGRIMFCVFKKKIRFVVIPPFSRDYEIKFILITGVD